MAVSEPDPTIATPSFGSLPPSNETPPVGRGSVPEKSTISKSVPVRPLNVIALPGMGWNPLPFTWKLLTPAMRRTGGGAIVNTSSVTGVVGIPYGIEYVTSKHGVLGATRGAACDAAVTGVRVNAVLPGSINTPMTAAAANNPEFADIMQAILERHTVGRLGEPEDVGYAVKWLLSDEASFINGAALPVDGGYTAR